ncbi:MAG: sugar ABC transporter ATP-binding protein [Treponema sp.]|jgi:ribose transport system ATP-binding protein|nr:sugar ABC transporter ATP-binding protein [Treponema sp.]
MSVILKCDSISKAFPGVQALDNVQFELCRGEIHALCGENGAGKSTLIKIITGIYQKDSGNISFNGKNIHYKSAQECRGAGIALIPQEIQLAETLTVAENILMTNYPLKRGIVSWKEMYKKTGELQKRLGRTALSFRPDETVKNLNMGQKQLVEIMKAISMDVKIIAFDEPTSSLSEEETESMFALVKQLTVEGVSIIYVSHRLAEIFRICDRVSVFKDGKYVGTRDTGAVTPRDIITMMVGRDIKLYERTEQKETGEAVLEVKNLKWKNKVKNLSFTLNKGEILGMFGIVGSGRTEMARALFGIEAKEDGEVYIRGQQVNIKSPEDAVKLGMGFVTEDRRSEGLSLVAGVAENVTLPFFRKFLRAGILNFRKEHAEVQRFIDLLNIKTPSLETKTENLSGGNQQKIVIAKWIGADSSIFIFDEPTRGIDVGAKSEIYRLMDELSRKGNSIIMISSELPEIQTMSDRLLVFKDGEIVKEFTDVFALGEEQILEYAIRS